MKNLTEKEWKKRISTDGHAVVIDTRTHKEWMEGTLENALLMDVMQPMQFEQDAKKLDKNKNYYLYCRSGQRSMRACAILEASGINETYNLLGGMLGWTGSTVVPAL